MLPSLEVAAPPRLEAPSRSGAKRREEAGWEERLAVAARLYVVGDPIRRRRDRTVEAAIEGVDLGQNDSSRGWRGAVFYGIFFHAW